MISLNGKNSLGEDFNEDTPLLAWAIHKCKKYGQICAAAFIAHNVFAGRLCKDRETPFMYHVETVANGFTPQQDNDDSSFQTKCHIVGWLHDVVEDTDWTIENLRQVGFSEDVVNAVNAITRHDDEYYFDFIVRCGRDPVARNVKLKDIKNNQNPFRLPRPIDSDDIERTIKYWLAHRYLSDIEKENIRPGTNYADWFEAKKQEWQDSAKKEKEADIFIPETNEAIRMAETISAINSSEIEREGYEFGPGDKGPHIKVTIGLSDRYAPR